MLRCGRLSSAQAVTKHAGPWHMATRRARSGLSDVVQALSSTQAGRQNGVGMASEVSIGPGRRTRAQTKRRCGFQPGRTARIKALTPSRLMARLRL